MGSRQGSSRSLAHEVFAPTHDASPAMAEAAAPTEEALQSQQGALKATETREGGSAGSDPQVVTLYEKTYDDNAGDRDKICAALGLDAAKWDERGVSSKETFVQKFLG